MSVVAYHADRLAAVLAAIDAANAADPTIEPVHGGGAGIAETSPAALLYGRRMTAALTQLVPDASIHLQIAARGQHIERWTSPRADYPEGRAGYLAWRKNLAIFHAVRLGALMEEAGYEAADADRVGALVRKENLKSDAEVQKLEDVIAHVFLRWYFAAFAAGRDPLDVRRIVAKTGRKMSAAGRAAALAEFDLPPAIVSALRG